MSVYINILFGASETAKISALRSVAPSLIEYAQWLNYAPHITLAEVQREASVDRLVSCAERLASGLGDLSIHLGAIGVFGGSSPVIWLSPVPSVGLLNAHKQLCAELGEIGVHIHYCPGNWIPHVTLAAGLDSAQATAALSALIPIFTPIHARPATVEIVEFPPARVLWTRPVT